MKKCSNCKHRLFSGFMGMPEPCGIYEMLTTEEEEIKEASSCKKYEEGNPFDDEDDYCSSSTNGDYSPSNPWDAPGMSIKDFI